MEHFTFKVKNIGTRDSLLKDLGNWYVRPSSLLGVAFNQGIDTPFNSYIEQMEPLKEKPLTSVPYLEEATINLTKLSSTILYSITIPIQNLVINADEWPYLALKFSSSTTKA